MLTDDSGVVGVVVKHKGKTQSLKAKAVVLAAGGFQSDPEQRTRYLGPGWELAKVRGTRFNTGDGIRMGLAAGAAATGNWSGCHAVAWERNAPEFGDLAVGDQFQKHSYPWGIYINAEGKRFVDEGADFRNYTYAKYGRVILSQPGQFAWQIFDAKVKAQLRDEYKIKQVTRRVGNTLEELVSKLEDTNQAAALEEIRQYNAAVQTDVPFNPNVKDGRGTKNLNINKSNWANTLDTPPFEAYAVTCGITFSFGGLKINTDAQVMSSDGAPIPGLYAAGRTGRRHFLVQLSRRHGTDQRRGVRQNRRPQRGPRLAFRGFLFRLFQQPGFELRHVLLARGARRAHQVIAARGNDRFLVLERRDELLVAQHAPQERQAPERHALPVDGGLHQLVVLAELQRARRLEIAQPVRVQPQVPLDPGGARVIHVQQHVRFQVRGRAQRPRRVGGERGAAYRDHPLLRTAAAALPYPRLLRSGWQGRRRRAPA